MNKQEHIAAAKDGGVEESFVGEVTAKLTGHPASGKLEFFDICVDSLRKCKDIGDQRLREHGPDFECRSTWKKIKVKTKVKVPSGNNQDPLKTIEQMDIREIPRTSLNVSEEFIDTMQE